MQLVLRGEVAQAEAAAELEIEVISAALARIAQESPRALTADSTILAPRKYPLLSGKTCLSTVRASSLIPPERYRSRSPRPARSRSALSDLVINGSNSRTLAYSRRVYP